MVMNFKAYSVIDHYSSGEPIVHELTEKNYGDIFDKVLEEILALEGKAKREFEEWSISMWVDANQSQSSSTIAAYGLGFVVSFRYF